MPANVNYRNSNTTLGYSQTDLIQLLVPREYFSQGGIYSWGAATDGALGNGQTIVSRSSPGVLSLTGQTSWQDVSMKGRTGAAVRSDGTLWTWGRGNYGVLGTNSTTTTSIPATVSGGGTNWEDVQAATSHMVAVKSDGSLWTWGRNANGQLGTNNTTSRSSPGTTAGVNIADWRLAVAGGENSAAIKIDGTLWTWGDNVSGQLGDGSTTDRSSPATVSGGGTNWEKVALSNLTGAGCYMAAIKSDGTLWTWGGNTNGKLGDGSTTSRSSPATVSGGGTNWYSIACGYQHTVATKTDGTLWTWGSNTGGALGVGVISARSSPDTVSGGGTVWKTTAAGNAISAAIKYDGTLWTWGQNSNGQLGDGSTSTRSSPVTVTGDLLNWTSVSLSATTTSGNMLGINQLDIMHFPEIDVYTVPGNYTQTIPEGNHTALVEVWGGGGPGGDGYGDGALTLNGGGGGGGGGYARSMLNVTFQVNKTMTINIGTGGIAQVGPGANSNVKSGTYSLTTIESAGGSTGGNGDLAGPGAGGTGGTTSGGTEVNTTGSTGSAGSVGGAGGSGANPVSGRNSIGYGNGGTGGTALGAGTWAGNNGANGAVVITYF